jgi:hypothetical protein
MNSFLKRFFPKVYRQKQDSKVSHYCQFNSELLTLFTSFLYIAGLVATLVASSIVGDSTEGPLKQPGESCLKPAKKPK